MTVTIKNSDGEELTFSSEHLNNSDLLEVFVEGVEESLCFSVSDLLTAISAFDLARKLEAERERRLSDI